MVEIDEATKQLLQKFGFEEAQAKPKLYYKAIDNETVAYIDFRKQNGRRFAVRGQETIDDEDSIEILKQFKEERDKILQSSSNTHSASYVSDEHVAPDTLKLGQGMTAEKTNETMKEYLKSSGDVVERQNNNIAGDVGQETILQNVSLSNHNPPDVKSVPAPNSNHKTFLDEIVFAYEIDIAELFGGAGEGKSQVVKQFALDAISQGKKVCFVDTERGFLKRDIAKLGSTYRYISSLKALMEFCKAIPKDIDLLIVDSVGYPVLTEWAKMGVNQRGDSLTQIIAIKDLIKDWAINNGKVAFVTNQPDSDFGKDKNYINRPFGDKGQFVIKEVFKIERVSRSSTLTKSVITAFRSRHDGFGMKIAEVEITEAGVKFI